jgi:hypothetical protein
MGGRATPRVRRSKIQEIPDGSSRTGYIRIQFKINDNKNLFQEGCTSAERGTRFPTGEKEHTYRKFVNNFPCHSCIICTFWPDF